MTTFDEDTAGAVAGAVEQFPATLSGGRVVFGFDGFVDQVREVVADRRDPDTHDRLDELAGFSDRVAASVAADSSLSFEWIQRGTRTGGHTCHLGRAFGKWGFDPVLVGMYGDPIQEPFEREFADYELHTLGEPGYTDAVEFDDGKLLLIENGDSMELDWDRLRDRVGRETLVNRLDGARLFGAGYWAETPNLPDLVAGLRELWSELADPPETVVVDPGDVRKLDPGRLRAGRDALGELDDIARVVLTANRAETEVLADTYGEGTESDRDAAGDAELVFDALDVALVVCHGLEESVVVREGGIHRVAVPVVDDPVLTTSSGDHFNAGLALALVEGMGPSAAAAVGNAVAGCFVRTGEPPSVADVRAFLDGYEAEF
ncbi:PfkB family carbohydrate kinase [Halobacteria archaeon HArc-gm2]|nr:PfkB family carbohydrate kinase [Halobacteria archaeon HArc-gm2]